jgi:hypothetical protein
MDRLRFNSVIYDITYALQNLQQYGSPEFIDSADNQGTAFEYDLGAFVRYSATGTSPFILYASLTAENNDTPSLTDSNWAPVKLARSGMYAATAEGNGSFTVPNGVYSIFGQAWGAGGAGGSTANAGSAASGGQPGGYVEGWVSVVPGQVINYSVGVPGTPTPGVYGQGGNGGSTVINFGSGTVWTAGGGGGGYGSAGGAQSEIGALPTVSGGEFSVAGSVGAGEGAVLGSQGYGGPGGAAWSVSTTYNSLTTGGQGSYPAGGGGGGANGGTGGIGGKGLIKFSW